jgi:L-threonylcarbamoyladenylate synthase
MKYKHYSPRARVVLFEVGGVGETGRKGVGVGDVRAGQTVGVVRTGGWGVAGGLRYAGLGEVAAPAVNGEVETETGMGYEVKQGVLVGEDGKDMGRLLDVDLGGDVKGVAHGLFAVLRELDRLGADVIFVEGVSDADDIAAAVMNRLRKAASEIRA